MASRMTGRIVAGRRPPLGAALAGGADVLGRVRNVADDLINGFATGWGASCPDAAFRKPAVQSEPARNFFQRRTPEVRGLQDRSITSPSKLAAGSPPAAKSNLEDRIERPAIRS
jgi:hypothetical protein